MDGSLLRDKQIKKNRLTLKGSATGNTYEYIHRQWRSDCQGW